MNQAENWKKNSVHTMEITGYSGDGAGVARLDGRVVFVPHTVKGEVWEVNLVKVNKSFAFGRGIQCLSPSESRLEKDCDFAGKCGGCQFRHVKYQEELEAKRQFVTDALTRLGGLNLDVPEVLGAKNTDRYRNKVQFPVSGSDKWVKIGFFRPRSHDVLDVPDCLLQTEEAGVAREVVKNWMIENHVNPYNETTGKGTVRHLFLRSNDAGEMILCLVVTREKLPKLELLVEQLKEKLPKVSGILLNVNKKDTNVVLGTEYRCLWGEEFLYEELCGLKFKLSVPSFFQVNLAQTEVLYQVVKEFTDLSGTETVLDLYCGIGTIGLMLAKKAKNITGIEIVEKAVEDAKENALRNHIENASFFHGDCLSLVQGFKESENIPDVVVMDPPRKGLAAEVPGLLGELAAKKLVYVSCDPATLARDLKKLTEVSYVVEKVQSVDLFPRTRHVETVALLVKR